MCILHSPLQRSYLNLISSDWFRSIVTLLETNNIYMQYNDTCNASSSGLLSIKCKTAIIIHVILTNQPHKCLVNANTIKHSIPTTVYKSMEWRVVIRRNWNFQSGYKITKNSALI